MAKKLPMKKNPLINPPSYPHDAPPLGEVKPEHAEQAYDWAIKKTRANIKKIVNNKYNPTFKNTIHALAFADEELDQVGGPFGQLKSVASTPELQKIQSRIQPKMVDLSTEISMNEALFARVKHVYDNVDRSKLSTEEGIILEKTYAGFVGGGALLKGKKRKEFAENSQKLAKLTTQYGNNNVNSAKELKVVVPAADKHRLKGVPEDMIAFYEQAGKNDDSVADGDFVIPMVPPPITILEQADDRSLRQEVAKVRSQVGNFGEYDNSDLVGQIVTLRHRQAKLLGYENHAARTVREDTRMATSFETVQDFLTHNASVYKPVAEEFTKELQEFAKERDGLEDFTRGDLLYYVAQYKKEKVGYDPEEARKYFELDNVLAGMFAHAEKLYGIKVKEVQGKYSTLHDDVKTYEVMDAETGDIKSLFYLDIFARAGKRSGAWATTTRNAGLSGGEQKIPVVFNYCNYPKPVDGQPTLLTDNEVTTLFHEFGHGCHMLMGKGTYPSLTGASVFWDYVELPSQINECWAFQPEVLATYAFDKDGNVMPNEIVEKLDLLGSIDTKWQGIRQTELALLDMAFYADADQSFDDLKAHQDAAWKDTAILPWTGPPMALTFNHIVAGGYSAGYYSYKWADALVADVFEQFEQKGLYDPELCKAFREKMIVPGGTRPPVDMFKDFMEAAGEGRRDLDADAMFRAEGILPKKAAPTPSV
jgi:peptidyl-dipeptidase Dcp